MSEEIKPASEPQLAGFSRPPARPFPQHLYEPGQSGSVPSDRAAEPSTPAEASDTVQLTGTISVRGGTAGGVLALNARGETASTAGTSATAVNLIPVSLEVGRAAKADSARLVLSAVTAELLLNDALERVQAGGLNSLDAPKLRLILRTVVELREALAGSAEDESVGNLVKSLSDGVLDWWQKDHVEILSRAYNVGLFFACLSMCGGDQRIAPLVSAAVVLGKDALKHVSDILKNLPGGR